MWACYYHICIPSGGKAAFGIESRTSQMLRSSLITKDSRFQGNETSSQSRKMMMLHTRRLIKRSLTSYWSTRKTHRPVFVAMMVEHVLGSNDGWHALTVVNHVHTNLLNSSSPSTAYMRQWIGSALVQIIACLLIGSALVQIITCRLFGARHYLNLWWVVVNWTLRNKPPWNFKQLEKFPFTNQHLKVSSAKWRPSCPREMCLNSLRPSDAYMRQ